MLEGTNVKPARDHFLSNRAYDSLKSLALLVLPALGTIYFILAGPWDFPNSEEVVGTIVTVDTFLGLLLAYSSKSYNSSESKYDGQIDIEQQDDTTVFSLGLNTAPSDLEYMKEVTFKVNPS